MDYLLLSSFSISGLHKKYTFVIIWTLSQRLHKKQEQTDTKNRLAVSALSNSWLSPSPQPVSFTFSCAAQYSEWPRSNINILRNKWTITTKFHTHTNTFWKHQKQKMCLRLFMPLSCSGFWRHKGFFLFFCFCIKPLKYTRKKQTEKKQTTVTGVVMGVTVSSARSKLVHTITVILYTAQKQLLSIVEQYCVQVLQQIHSDQMKTMFFKCYIHYCMHTHVYKGEVSQV